MQQLLLQPSIFSITLNKYKYAQEKWLQKSSMKGLSTFTFKNCHIPIVELNLL